jgi:ELWxxDGT repeat protein/cysteine-rich repeat protein
LTDGGDVLFLRAGAQLWKSDGTEAGTVAVGDDRPACEMPRPEELAVVGDTLYFTSHSPAVPGGTALWKTDGISMSVVTDSHPATGGAEPTALGDVLFFRKCFPSDFFNWYPCSLWKTDGVTTTLVADVPPAQPTVAGNAIFFTTAPIFGILWKTDGATSGPVAAAGIQSADQLTAVGDTLFFTAYEPETGVELWKTDGRTASAVADIVPGYGSSSPHALAAAAGTLFFSASQPATGHELWKTDGVTTTLVADIEPGPGGSSPTQLTAVGGGVFFVACDSAHGCELWHSDGGSASLVADLAPGSASPRLSDLTNLGGTLYFSACTDAYGCELWKSDGTTATVIDSVPGPDGIGPYALTRVRHLLFFAASDAMHGTQLWALEGTCGNGAPDPGEECDDGNLTSGDGCDADCRDEHVVVTTPTPSSAPTPAPTATVAPPCPPRPLDDCSRASDERGSFALRDKTPDDRDSLEWTWNSAAPLTRADLGDPAAPGGTGYALCVYDGVSNLVADAEIPAGGLCGVAAAKPCWQRTVGGWRYDDRRGTRDGIRHVQLKERRGNGRAFIKVSGKGVRLDDPALPLRQPVTVQFHRTDSNACWQSSYTAPAVRNGKGQFRDRPD